MKDKYKEIKIGRPAFKDDEEEMIIEVELDDVVDIDEPTIEDEDVETTPAPASDKEPEVEPTSEKPKAEKRDRAPRAQKRIRELHAQREEALRRLEEAEREKEELQKMLLKERKTSTSEHKNSIEMNIAKTKEALANAVREGDADKVADMQEALTSLQMQRAKMDHDLKTVEEEVTRSESAPKKATRPTPSIPEEAALWIEDHPAFNEDPVFNAAAIAVNNQLIKQGWDPESEEFYAEITKRLTPRFPEVFGIATEKEVELDIETDSPPAKGVKDKAPRVTTQTVAGSSRPSGTGVVQPKKIAQVSLSEQERKQGERWGMSLDRLAKRKAFIEKNRTGDNGYVPIIIDRN